MPRRGHERLGRAHKEVAAEELGLANEKEPLSLSVDNTGARDIAYNPEHHQKVKHIARRHFFVRA